MTSPKPGVGTRGNELTPESIREQGGNYSLLLIGRTIDGHVGLEETLTLSRGISEAEGVNGHKVQALI